MKPNKLFSLCLTLLVGLIVAGVVFAAKIRFALRRVNHSKNPQIKEVNMGFIKKIVASIARLNPAGSLSAVKMQSLLLTLTLMVAAFWVSPAAAQQYVTDPATGKTWTAPEYGGTLTWAHKQFPKSTDPYSVGGWGPHFISAVNEKLAFGDWAVDREKVVDLAWTYTGPEMYRGCLAESWEMPDATTFIFHIRQGVHWHDKAPMNGRELTADDIVFNWHRYLGQGDFTEEGPSPLGYITQGLEDSSVTATDEWTVEFKLAKPKPDMLFAMTHNANYILAPEVIEKYGDYADWRNVVGTGPYRLTDHVEGSSATWEKNPNYWGYDEKFPENRLPYIDVLRSLLIPDDSARLAALRTGRIDMISNTGDAQISNIDHITSLQKTNPEIEVWPVYRPLGGDVFNQSLPPFDDINVRKALQMSLDHETIADTFLKGWGVPGPHGFFTQASTGFAWPYADWPDEIKEEYTYNPERAEELLDAAGYKRGADGYRMTVKFGHFARYDQDYSEIILAYFDAIGVKSEMVMITDPELPPIVQADTHEFVTSNWAAYPLAVPGTYVYLIARGRGDKYGNSSWSKAKDPEMDTLLSGLADATEVEEWLSYHRQVDEKTIREHWGLARAQSPSFSVSQPWVEGYAGEWSLGYSERNTHFARLWIDQELKKSMGH